MNGIIFFICLTLAISALFAAPKISAWLAALRWRKEFRNKKKEKGLCPSRDQQWWICLLFLLRQVLLPLQVRSKSPGMSRASGKPGGRMNLEASSFDAASASQVRLKDAYLGGLKEKQQGDLSHEREENSGETDDSESEPWYYRPVAQANEACGKPLAGEIAESSSSAVQKSQNNKEATSEHFFAISQQTISYTEAVYDMVRKRPAGDPMKDLDMNVGTWEYLWMLLSEQPWREFEKCAKFFLENYRTTFQGNRKVDQWSNRDYWYKPDWHSRFKVVIDKLVAQSSSSIRHCQGLRLFRLGAVLLEKTILLDLGRTRFSGI